MLSCVFGDTLLPLAFCNPQNPNDQFYLFDFLVSSFHSATPASIIILILLSAITERTFVSFYECTYES